jgi:membrane protein insertase Oxa1/YidC/SpoIIIJ
VIILIILLQVFQNLKFFFRMTKEIFESLRLIIIIVAVLLRMVLMPIYLQAYLNLAYERIEEQKKEAGRITNTEYKQVKI